MCNNWLYYLEELLKFPDIDLIRQVIKHHSIKNFHLEALPALELMLKLPTYFITFNTKKFLDDYLVKMQSLSRLKLKPNLIVIERLIKLYPNLKEDAEVMKLFNKT